MQPDTFQAVLPNQFLALVGAADDSEFGPKFLAAWTGMSKSLNSLTAQVIALGTREEIVTEASSKSRAIAEQAANNTVVDVLGAVGMNVVSVPASPSRTKMDDSKGPQDFKSAAQSILAQAPLLSKSQAIAKAIDAYPELYAKYQETGGPLL